MRTEIKTTADGSATLFVPELNEHYHSVHGAVQESMHVFIGMGLLTVEKDVIRILEVGFGTGLNASLTLLHAPVGKTIYYDSLEKYPLEWKLVEQMDYSSQLKLTPEQQELFRKMHRCNWNSEQIITRTFSLNKVEQSLSDFEPDGSYDLVYFDAFAPEVQPELWEEEIFRKIFLSLNPQAQLVTYCAKGEVRRRMQRVGFEVERLPGPPGKREMLRAIKRE